MKTQTNEIKQEDKKVFFVDMKQEELEQEIKEQENFINDYFKTDEYQLKEIKDLNKNIERFKELIKEEKEIYKQKIKYAKDKIKIYSKELKEENKKIKSKEEFKKNQEFKLKILKEIKDKLKLNPNYYKE